MTEHETNRRQSRAWVSWAVLALLVVAGLILRWRYIREISLSVDEFNTIWAARQVLIRGLPIFPSGDFYPHGFIFTYLEVPFVLGPLDETVARLAGLIVSLAAIGAAYAVGRRLFSERAGLMAAAVLAVDPDAILWGGRARMYGLLQLLTLLVVFFYYRGLAEDRPRERTLAMGLLVLAIFTQAEAALLLPALAVATLVAWPWRRLLRRQTVLPFVLGAAGAGVFFLISKFGQPGHLETLQESRPYLEVGTSVLSGPRLFAPVLTAVHRLPFTLLAVAGLYALFRPLQRVDRRSPLTYLYVVLLAVLIPLVFLAGPTWQNERYLFLLLPLLFTIAAEAASRLLDRLPGLGRTARWQPAGLALLAAVYVGLTGSHLAYVQEPGYDLAFRYVRSQWQPEAGDRVVSLSPSACALYLGSCDRFAIQRGYQEFIVDRPGDGLPADLWTATPVLTQTAEFVDLLATAPRVWFVSDGWRFQTRYDVDFIQTVLDQMVLEYDERGVMVWSAKGITAAPQPAVQRARSADFGGQVALAGFDLSSANPNAGGELQIDLHWQALEGAGTGYTAFLHLLGPDGAGVAGVDEPLLGGFYQPDLWPRDAILIDRHRLALPADLPPGRYRLDLGLYPSGEPGQTVAVQGGDRLPLATLTVGEATPPPAPEAALDVTFGDRIRLLGYDLDCDAQGLACALQLHWQAVAPMDRDYTVFIHLVDQAGEIVAQDDRPPGQAFFGTSTWLPGAVVLDTHTLAVPADAPPGEVSLLVGLYYQPTGQRLEAVNARGESPGDALPLETLIPDLGSP